VFSAASNIFSRLCNVVLNILIVRQTGVKLYGVREWPSHTPNALTIVPFQVLAVPFQLLLSTVQFLSREGVRNATQRVDLQSHAPGTAKGTPPTTDPSAVSRLPQR